MPGPGVSLQPGAWRGPPAQGGAENIEVTLGSRYIYIFSVYSVMRSDNKHWSILMFGYSKKTYIYVMFPCCVLAAPPNGMVPK